MRRLPSFRSNCVLRPSETPLLPAARDALRAAREKVEAQEAEKARGADKGTDKPAAGPDRGEGGRFAAKDTKPAGGEAKPAAGDDGKPAAAAAPANPAAQDPPPAPVKRTVTAPERFSNDAKAVWDTAPEPVKAEVDRMHREMTAGIEKHRAKAENYRRQARDEEANAERLDQYGQDLAALLTAEAAS